MCIIFHPEPVDLGFVPVHQPQSPAAELIFIHGLNGDRCDTWTNASQVFWLSWLDRHLPHVRVWTYGYNASVNFGSQDTLRIHATNFLSKLSDPNSGIGVIERPIVFVAHSLGGILVKEAMIIASSPRSIGNSIFRNAAGIVFLGTPHRGSSSANRASLLIRLITGRQSPRLLRLLCANTSSLARTAGLFNSVWGSRRIFSFCETNPTFGIAIIVPHEDAITHCSGEEIYDIPDCNHTEISKPDSEQSILFTKLLDAIRSLLPQPELRYLRRPVAGVTPASLAPPAPSLTPPVLPSTPPAPSLTPPVLPSTPPAPSLTSPALQSLIPIYRRTTTTTTTDNNNNTTTTIIDTRNIIYIHITDPELPQPPPLLLLASPTPATVPQWICDALGPGA